MDTGNLNWRMPQPFCSTLEVLEKTHPLFIYNSLTRTKTRFIPKNPERVTWYQCGPTVYADSHMGHARTYVSLDVVRRIMKEFLGYNLIVCQNITDIDDKIIKKSSESKIPFSELGSKYEAEFFADMNALGVSMPDISTRVSEYVPEIIEYIQVLVDKKIAYESNGSVYFSVEKFELAGHKYGKLMPEQIGNSVLLAEGEGELVVAEDKKAPSDFVLWKKTKIHTPESGIVEPSWESPWGPGRPGWHIECSVMSTYAMKQFESNNIDVHAGGIDLKFPHHENEIAQSEGYHNSHQWVNYWLHTGHLHIKGFKMSKSLKNFITIQSALQLHTSRQIRICFLLHKYSAPMDYGDNTMNEAIAFEKTYSEFFHNVKAVLRRVGINGSQQILAKESLLMEKLEAIKSQVRESLLDDFDTPRAMGYLSDLVRETNKYMELENVSTIVLTSAARYLTSILSVLGLVSSSSTGSEVGIADIGFNNASTSNSSAVNDYLDAFTKFREMVRLAALAGDNQAVLRIADELRDDILPELGIRMEDKGSGSDAYTIWKLEDPEVLRLEKQQKESLKLAKELQKEEAAKKNAEREARAKIPPEEMFLNQTDLYLQFDNSTGLPTHDNKGEPLSKSVIKKLQKEQSKQKEAFEKYLHKK
eukprot:gene8487-11473_t